MKEMLPPAGRPIWSEEFTGSSRLPVPSDTSVGTVAVVEEFAHTASPITVTIPHFASVGTVQDSAAAVARVSTS